MARTADEDGRNLRGHSADRVIVDEAAYIRDSVIHEVISPMLADRNGQLVMISTPFGKNHFYRAFMKGVESRERRVKSGGREGSDETPSPLAGEGRGEGGNPKSRCASFTFPSWTNPHISSEYIESQRGELSTRQFAVEYEAKFLDDQSSVFPWEEIEAAASGEQISNQKSQITNAVVAGIDWARYSDYTAIVALEVGENSCSVVGIDRFNGMGWSQQIERSVEFLKKHRVTAVLTDRTSIGDPLLDQLRSHLWESSVDIAVEGYMFAKQSKRELVEGLSI